jgi:NADH-quinone oxidoreductase subunit L
MSGLLTAAMFVLGLLIAWQLYVRRRGAAAAVTASPLGSAVHRWWYADWGMDWLYDRLFVRPVVWFARVDKGDFVDAVYNGLASLCGLFWRAFSATETGRVRWYAAGIAGGAAVFLFLVLMS